MPAPGSVPRRCCHRVARPAQVRHSGSWAWFVWLRWFSNQGNGPAHPLQRQRFRQRQRCGRSAPATPGLRPRDLHQFLGRGPSRMSSSRRSCDQLQPKLRGERPSGGVLQELIQPGVVSGGNGSCSWIRGGGGSPPGSQTGPHTAAGSIVLSPCQVRCPNEALEHDGVQTENSEN